MNSVPWNKSRLWKKYRKCVAVFLIVIVIFYLCLFFCLYDLRSPVTNLGWPKEETSNQKEGALSSSSGAKHAGPVSDDDGEEVQKSGRRSAGDKTPPNKLAHGVEAATILSGRPVAAVGGEAASNISLAAGGRATTVSVSGKVVAKMESEALAQQLAQLGVVPDCDIVTKEAVSAINRAKSVGCKREIADLVCRARNGQLYPKRLPRNCPSKGRQLGDYLGCYQDDKKDRLLSGHLNKYVNNTPQHCIDLCLQSGYHLAGVQYGVECFCGDDFPSAKFQLQEENCDIPCPGDAGKRCGGFYTENIYHTGLSKLPKLPSPSPSSSSNSTEARVLFLLTLNGRAIRQVRRLIKTLYHDRQYFYIHVDERQEYMYRELLPLESQFPNIRLSRRRLSTIWGGASLLQMMLNCMEDVLAIPDWNWDFFINLSESDFPIKRHDELMSFLRANKGKNFLKSHGRDTQRFIVKQGLDKTFFECEARMWRIGDRQLPLGIRIDGGSDWVALSQDLCRYLITTDDELVAGLKVVYQHTLLPAESFFHTVVRNSEFCDTFVDNNLHVTNWKRKVGCRCQYKHVVDWCGCSPNVFKPDDWLRIRTADARPFYFARKFEPIINQGVIDQLETWLYGPLDPDLPGLTSYWQNEFHSDDAAPCDNASLSAYHSFGRLGINLLDELANRCPMLVGEVKEATLFNDNDVFKGTLVMFVAHIDGSPNDTIELETRVEPRQFYRVHKTVGPAARLKSIQVGTRYDQKEQLFRDFGQIVGPYSEPCLLHKWNEGDAFSATFVWVDPTNTVGGSFEVKVEAGVQTSFHKPVFQLPLRPGIWTVKFMYEWELMSETKFLVVPLSHVNGEKITLQQAKSANGGPAKHYIDHDFTNVEKLFGYRNNRVLRMRARANSHKTDVALHKWVDSLTAKFYTLQDTCYLADDSMSERTRACIPAALERCHATSWSSRYPDPKSRITGVESGTGRLRR